MRIVLKFALAACVAQASFASAQAQSTGIESVPEFRPFLSTNADAVICEPFLKSWTELFDAVSVLEEDKVDIAATFPQAKVRRLTNFYENAQKVSVDVDTDGADEILYFNPTDVGWRYLGPELHLFESEADFKAAIDVYGPETRWGIDFDNPKAKIIHPLRRPLHHYGAVDSIDLIQLNGAVYLTNNVTYPTEDEPSEAVLFRVGPDGIFQTICAVVVLPAKSTFAEFRDTSQLYSGLRDVYGEPTYPGTMGWTAAPADAALSTILYRPWAMKVVGRAAFSPALSEPAREDVARELRFLSWGASDPQSWRDYLDVKAGRTKFIADMRHHYSVKFAKPGRQATALSEQAWRYLMDEVVYARNPDSHDLAGLAYVAEPGLRIAPDSSPEQILHAVVAGSDQPEVRGALSSDMQDKLALAAIELRQPTSYVRELAERALSNSAYTFNPEERQLFSQRKTALLLAALGHSSLSEFAIEFGADPNAKTGNINKTPLMYAAQQDRLNAVRLLLTYDVDVDAYTENRQYGYSLARDHRTALMYAAENASPPVIDALLKAGADISAKDTKGNAALWYFGRNVKITDQAERKRISARLGG